MPNFFDPEVISKIKGYDIRAKRIVEGFLVGVHKSPTIGTGMEFKQHREYVQGDDVRRLDWKVYAKTDKFFIKQFESETNMACQFVIDCSESMSYKGDAPMSKFEYSCTAAASLSYLLLGNRDAIGFTFFDDVVRTHIPAKATQTQFHHGITTMENITPGSKTMAGGALMSVGNSIKRPGMLIVFSDFIDDIDPITLGLNRLAFDGHEVVVINVADPNEIDFPFSGPSIIEGMEGTGNLRCDPSDYREVYLESRERHFNDLRHACRRLRFDLHDIVTSTPIDEALAEILLNRMQLVVR